MFKKCITHIKNCSRRDKIFFAVFFINLCFVTVFGIQLGETVAHTLNEKAQMPPVTGEGAIRSGEPKTSMAAIVCNVDWGEKEIPQMIKIFKEKDIKITFFPCGRWAKNNPEIVRDMYVNGHEIGNHGYGHKLCSKISVEELKTEILNTQEVIAGITGMKTNLFAPPSGDFDKNTIALCEDLGYEVILWTADTIDWKEGSSAKVIKERVLKKDLNGAIILMHPKPETVKALPDIIDEIKKRGIKLVTVSELLKASGLTQ